MPSILITRAHALPLDQARAKVDAMAHKLADELNLTTYWSDDTLRFKRSGVSGTIQVKERSVAIAAELGLLLSPLKGTIEKQIQDRLTEELGPAV